MGKPDRYPNIFDDILEIFLKYCIHHSSRAGIRHRLSSNRMGKPDRYPNIVDDILEIFLKNCI